MISRLRSFRYWHEVVLAALLVGLFVWAGVTEPFPRSPFISFNVQRQKSSEMWELALLAIPMTLIIITAGIDLSVGSAMGLCAVVLGLTFKAGMSPWLGAALAIACGAVIGAGNGLFVAKVRVHPLIVTLATLAAFRGAAEGLSYGESVSNFPAAFSYLSRGELLGLPVPAWLFALFAILTAIVLTKTPFGRYLYAIGHNETAVRFSGVPVDRIKMILYTLAGATAGLTAVLYAARRDTAKADVGDGLELDVITAVVLGGTSIFGGRGNILGTVLGVILVHETRQIVSWHRYPVEWKSIVIGLVLIGSVLLNRVLSVRGRQG
jgi:rhamnose transport system permease protein